MAINGILFDNQSPTAKGLRGGFHSALSDGILEGCGTDNSSGFSLNIEAGLMHVAGGIFFLAGGQSILLSYDSSKTYARIKAVMDLSQATTPSFNQISFVVDYASSANNFTNLVQEGVNIGTGTRYEAEIFVVQLNASGISKFVRTARAFAKIQYGNTLPADAPEGTIFLLKVT